MRNAIRHLATDHHRSDKLHTVCILSIVQILVIWQAGPLLMASVITGLIFIRDLHLELLMDDPRDMGCQALTVLRATEKPPIEGR